MIRQVHPFNFTAVLALLMAISCGACSQIPQGVLLPSAQAETEGASAVPILVATTRKRSISDAGEMFDGSLAEQLSYASLTVSIPPDASRKIGEVQWPTSLPADPRQSFVTVSADHLDKRSFVAALSSAAKQAGRGRGKVLVFVHGFNNRFAEAVYRFAQIKHDSGAPAVPILFSWPSSGEVSLTAYRDDLEGATNSRAAFEELLDTLALDANVKEVTLVCHSMGCFLTLEALRSKATRTGRIGAKIKNVLLVAPDVDINLFRVQMREMGRARPRFALFMSHDDHALKLSKSISGGAPRLGDVDPDQDPYKTDFQRERIMVFDLSGLHGRAHSRAFEDVTSVMGMIERRLAQGQQMTSKGAVE